MPFNISTIFTGLQTIAQHPATKGAALSSLFVGGLYVAGAAGLITVAPWETALAGFAGTAIYHFLPPIDQAAVDNVTQDVIDIAQETPKLEDTYPPDKNTGIAAGDIPNA